MSRSVRPWICGGLVVVLVVALDQLTKALILDSQTLLRGDSIDVLPVFSFTLAYNYGISMGLLQAQSDIGRWLLVILQLGIIGWLVQWLLKAEHGRLAVALGLIVGGAIGNNVIDRVRFGYVVDFLHFHAYGWSFYIFNVADAAITVGVALWLLDMALQARNKKASRA